MYDQAIDWDNSPTLLADVFNTELTYDAMNRPIEILQPDDSVVAYAYNKAGLLETVQAKIRGITTYTEFVTNIDYNEKGQRTAIYYRNGSKTAYTYDNESFRLTNLKTTRDSGNDTLQDIDYTYDAVGNITEVADNAQQTFYYSNSVIAPRGKYWYDALYRLTKATGRELASLALPTDTDFTNNIPIPNTDSSAMQNYTQEFSYDELGNINQMKSVGDWTRDYYYETTNNRLKNHDGGSDVYAYDEHGNCTEMPHLPELIWDYKDELKEVTLNASNHKAYYVYDSAGERVRKVVDKGSVVEERLYIGGFEIYRKTVSGTLDYERETLKITEGRNTIAQLETKTVENGNTISTPTTNQRLQYSNHLGSACLELDSSSNIISYEEYHPFGTTSYRCGTSETEVSQKRYKYVGKERDEETGLYYYGARYYAAWIARFVSVDPLQFKYPQLTPFNYAGNKPVTHIDIDGMQGTGDVQYYNSSTGEVSSTSHFNKPLEVAEVTIEAKKHSIFKSAREFMKGVGKGIWGGMKGTFNFFTKDMWKKETWKGMGNLFLGLALVVSSGFSDAVSGSDLGPGPEQAVDSLIESTENAANTIINGSPEEKGEIVGQIAWGVVEGSAGSKGVNLLEKSKIAKSVLSKGDNVKVLNKVDEVAGGEYLDDFARMGERQAFPGNPGAGAYETALTEGGTHSGWLKTMSSRPTPQLQKGISSIRDNILEHQNLISDPEKYMKVYKKGDWSALDPRQQKHLQNIKWPGDIQRAYEQINILEGIIKSR